MGLIVHGGSKTVKSSDAQKYDHDHQHETELRFVNTVVLACKPQTDPVIERSRDDLSNDAENEW
jgi:hypothetical protein